MNSDIPGLELRGLRADDIDALHEIDTAAGKLIAMHPGYPGAGIDEVPIKPFGAMLASSEVIIADMEGKPVGFSAAHHLDGIYWLRELSVDPQFGRRGIGTALLKAVFDRANWEFYNAVGLSTFRNIPFNQPFYERLGFVAVDSRKASFALRKQFTSEIPTGVNASSRVLMVRKL